MVPSASYRIKDHQSEVLTGSLATRIFYAGWREHSSTSEIGYVPPNVIQPTLVDGTPKGLYDIVVNGNVITVREILCARNRKDNQHQEKSFSGGNHDDHDHSQEDGGIAHRPGLTDSVEGDSDSRSEKFTDAFEHLSDQALSVATPAAGVSHTAAFTTDTKTGVERCISQARELARAEQHKHPKQTDVFCCRESALMFWARLMALSCELRQMVHAPYLAGLPKTFILRTFRSVDFVLSGNIAQLLWKFPPLCRTNQQTFNESIPVLLHNKRIILGHQITAHKLLTDFLDLVPQEKAFKAITDLHMEELKCIRDSDSAPTLRLFQLCTALEHLHITVHAAQFVEHTPFFLQKNKTHTRPSSKDEVLSKFQMRHVYELPKLKNLVLVCNDGALYANSLNCTEADIFEHLVTWLPDEHQRRHARFELRVRYTANGDRHYADCFLGWGSRADGDGEED
ncbi:hypothetical protein BDW02DRAFT_319780 [Decorospora gaudefroyi]|uniref:Uncharacterized protein n=1 Tax=Decorospora gaudefroyi TaxID=184978 RepID=A0A6A5KH99_9PLEO|nr:hypothetical protein BDW02DRAFT_319780 [Decorospora gaudefroyi]